MKKRVYVSVFIVLASWFGCTNKYERVGTYEGISPYLDSLKTHEDSLLRVRAQELITEFYGAGKFQSLEDSLNKASYEQENETKN